jgi:hypothetical protein
MDHGEHRGLARLDRNGVRPERAVSQVVNGPEVPVISSSICFFCGKLRHVCRRWNLAEICMW